MKDRNEYERLLNEANAAKNRLADLAVKLEEAGYHRKSKSCMTLVYSIEEWQMKK